MDIVAICCVGVFIQSDVIYILYKTLSTSQLDCNGKEITINRIFKNEKENISEKGK